MHSGAPGERHGAWDLDSTVASRHLPGRSLPTGSTEWEPAPAGQPQERAQTDPPHSSSRLPNEAGKEPTRNRLPMLRETLPVTASSLRGHGQQTRDKGTNEHPGILHTCVTDAGEQCTPCSFALYIRPCMYICVCGHRHIMVFMCGEHIIKILRFFFFH